MQDRRERIYFCGCGVASGVAAFLAFLAFFADFFMALRSFAVSFLAASLLVGGVSSAAMALKATKTTAARAAAIVRIIVYS